MAGDAQSSFLIEILFSFWLMVTDAVPTVAGSHMTQFRPSTPRIPGEPGSFVPGEVGPPKSSTFFLVLTFSRNASNVESPTI
jgi:hypothetical protein